jgi:hypothetical protein
MRWLWRHGGREVRLDYNFWTGARRVAVDGEEITRAKNLAWRWSHPLALGDDPATVRVRIRWLFTLAAELEVAGELVPPAAVPRELPAWAWVFVLASAAIVVVAGGGAIPGGLAGAGAMTAIGIARSELTTGERLALCALATAAAWGAFLLIARVLGG